MIFLGVPALYVSLPTNRSHFHKSFKNYFFGAVACSIVSFCQNDLGNSVRQKGCHCARSPGNRFQIFDNLKFRVQNLENRLCKNSNVILQYYPVYKIVNQNFKKKNYHLKSSIKVEKTITLFGNDFRGKDSSGKLANGFCAPEPKWHSDHRSCGHECEGRKNEATCSEWPDGG